jgi:two-component system chemotaxis response regulator CheY
MISDLKVLLCDDSLMVIKKMSDTLKAIGVVHIQTALDGNQAISLYKLNRPDIVFLDHVMPNKTGLEALAEILVIDPTAKVYMLSSMGTVGKREEAHRVGALGFLQKPVETVQIKEALDEVLKTIG